MPKDHMYNIVDIVDDIVLYNSNLPREYNLLLSPKWKTKNKKTDDIQMANKHTKIMFASYVIRKTQSKTTMRYHYNSIRMVKI